MVRQRACFVGADGGGTPHGLRGTQPSHQVVVLQHALHRVGQSYRHGQGQALWDSHHLQPRLRWSKGLFRLMRRSVLDRGDRCDHRKFAGSEVRTSLGLWCATYCGGAAGQLPIQQEAATLPSLT